MTARRTMQDAERATQIFEETLQRTWEQLRSLRDQIDARTRRIAELEAAIGLMAQINHDAHHQYSSAPDWQTCPFPDCDTPQRVLRVGRHADPAGADERQEILPCSTDTTAPRN